MNKMKVWGYRAVGAAATAGSSFMVARAAFAEGIDATNIDLPLGTADPEQIVRTVLNWALGFLALIAVIMVLIGGFMWMTSGGAKEKTDKAKKLLYAALAGLVIILAAWGLTIYAFSVLGEATGTEVTF